MLRLSVLAFLTIVLLCTSGTAEDRLLTVPDVIDYDLAQFSPDGRYIAALCDLPRRVSGLAIWEHDTGELVMWQLIRGGVGGFQFSPQSRNLVLSTYDGKFVHFLGLEGSAQNETWKLQAKVVRQKHPASRLMGGTGFVFSEDGQTIASTSGRPPYRAFTKVPGEIEVWNTQSQSVINRIPTPDSFCSPIAIQDNELIFTTGSAIYRGNLQDESLVAQRSMMDFHSKKPIASGAARALDVSPDGESIAIGGGGFLVELDTKTFELKQTFEFSDEDFSSCVHYTPDGKYLIHGQSFRFIRVLDVTSGKLVSQHPFSNVDSLDVSPDGSTIALTSMVNQDGVHLWDLKARLP